LPFEEPSKQDTRDIEVIDEEDLAPVKKVVPDNEVAGDQGAKEAGDGQTTLF
jgi:hypothetical protein